MVVTYAFIWRKFYATFSLSGKNVTQLSMHNYGTYIDNWHKLNNFEIPISQIYDNSNISNNKKEFIKVDSKFPLDIRKSVI